jgi:hypothetical protein
LLNGHSFESPAQKFIASNSKQHQQAAPAAKNHSKQQQQNVPAYKVSTCPQQAEVYIFNSSMVHSSYTSTVTDMSQQAAVIYIVSYRYVPTSSYTST